MSRIKDAETLVIRLMQCFASLDSGKHKVFDPDVGEGASCHDAVIATTTAVAVEVFRGYLVIAEESSCRRFLLDGSSR